MTTDSLDLDLFTADAEPPPLSSFDLGSPAGRHDFLWTLSEIGTEGLLAATAHVWNSLLPPQSVRAALIAKSAGINAQGKGALYLVLEAFLVTFEHDCDPPPLPERSSFASSEAWHAAVQDHFATGAATMERVITTFSGMLDSGKIGPASLNGTSIMGPSDI